VATVRAYSGFSKSTVEYFDIIGDLCAGNGKGEYPGLLLTSYVLYSFVYTMRCYVKKVQSGILEEKKKYEVSAELRVNVEVAATLKYLGKDKGMAQAKAQFKGRIYVSFLGAHKRTEHK
jgi:hypothetical protein